MWGDQSVYEGGYRVVAGMHVMVAYGYDDGGVYLSDPATGGSRYYDWGTFEWMWGVMDGMSSRCIPPDQHRRQERPVSNHRPFSFPHGWRCQIVMAILCVRNGWTVA